ncbi:MAG: cell division protein ZapA [Limnohabitans sp.]|nr:cell division protein ZapA [Limnohabitans sp.]
MKDISLNALVADRTYRIVITADDESDVRGLLKIINDKILEFKSVYAGKDMQDFVSITLLWFISEYAQSQKEEKANPLMAERLKTICDRIQNKTIDLVQILNEERHEP